jgi:hypothetical protein
LKGFGQIGDGLLFGLYMAAFVATSLADLDAGMAGSGRQLPCEWTVGSWGPEIDRQASDMGYLRCSPLKPIPTGLTHAISQL